MNTAANHLASKYAKQIDISSCSQKPIVVGLLGNSSTDYLLTLYGLVKLGVLVFPLSIRNSKDALEHLIKETEMSYLIIGPGQTHVKFDGLKVIELEPVDWNGNDNFPCSIHQTDNDVLERPQIILHR